MSEVLPAIALYHRDQSLPYPHILSYTSTNMQTTFLPSLSLLLIPTVEVLAPATINIPPPSNMKIPCSSHLKIPATIFIFTVINTYVYNPNPESLSLGLPLPTLATALVVWQPGAGRGGGLRECKCVAVGKLGLGRLVCLLVLFLLALLIRA